MPGLGGDRWDLRLGRGRRLDLGLGRHLDLGLGHRLDLDRDIGRDLDLLHGQQLALDGLVEVALHPVALPAAASHQAAPGRLSVRTHSR